MEERRQRVSRDVHFFQLTFFDVVYLEPDRFVIWVAYSYSSLKSACVETDGIQCSNTVYSRHVCNSFFFVILSL